MACVEAWETSSSRPKSLAIHDRYFFPLVERWCDQNGLWKIDLCGEINSVPACDSVGLHGGRIAADLNQRRPFGDGEAGIFRDTLPSNTSATQSTRWKNSIAVWPPPGWLLSQPPSTDGRGAFQDPTHVSFWNSNSFWYDTNADLNRFIDGSVRFQVNRLKNFFPSEWHRDQQIVYVMADLLKIAGGCPVARRTNARNRPVVRFDST